MAQPPPVSATVRALAPAIIPLLFAGLVTTLLIGYRLYGFVWLNFFHASSIGRYKHGRPGYAWALVTGASDGIGKAFCFELAARGFNVVLHGRNQSKISALIDTLQKEYPKISFQAVIADASNSHGMKAGIEGVARSVSNLPGPLTVLVNNVGGLGGVVAPNPWRALALYDHATVDAVLNINIRFTTQLTRALLPTILAPKKPALIITAGSLAGNFGMPYLAVYSGTKAYLKPWSFALAGELELQGHDVECLHLQIGQTTDAGGFDEAATFMAPGARTVAAGALARVGCGRPSVAPALGHAVQSAVTGLLPGWALVMMNKSVVRQQLKMWDEKAKKAT